MYLVKFAIIENDYQPYTNPRFYYLIDMIDIYRVSHILELILQTFTLWSNSKMWEKREIFVILHEATVAQLFLSIAHKWI